MAKHMKSVRLAAAALFAVALLVMITGCGKGEDPVKDVATGDLAAAMTAAETTLPATETLTEESPEPETVFTAVSDMDYSKVDGFFICYSTEGKADEIAVIKVKDTKDTEEALASLTEHKEKRESMYATYDPTQVERVANGLAFSKGQYAVLIITDHPEDVKAAFENEVAE